MTIRLEGFVIFLYILVFVAIITGLIQFDKYTDYNRALSKQVIINKNEIKELKKQNEELKKSINRLSHKKVTVTSYTNLKHLTDDTPNITACGTKPRPGTIAVSQDLFLSGWVCGKKVDLAGIGIVTVNDKMHPRKKDQVDLFLPSLYAAVQFGVKRNRKAILLNI